MSSYVLYNCNTKSRESYCFWVSLLNKSFHQPLLIWNWVVLNFDFPTTPPKKTRDPLRHSWEPGNSWPCSQWQHRKKKIIVGQEVFSHFITLTSCFPQETALSCSLSLGAVSAPTAHSVVSEVTHLFSRHLLNIYYLTGRRRGVNNQKRSSVQRE